MVLLAASEHNVPSERRSLQPSPKSCHPVPAGFDAARLRVVCCGTRNHAMTVLIDMVPQLGASCLTDRGARSEGGAVYAADGHVVASAPYKPTTKHHAHCCSPETPSGCLQQHDPAPSPCLPWTSTTSNCLLQCMTQPACRPCRWPCLAGSCKLVTQCEGDLHCQY